MKEESKQMEQLIAGQNTGDVIDVTMDNFMAEVVEASKTKLFCCNSGRRGAGHVNS